MAFTATSSNIAANVQQRTPFPLSHLRQLVVNNELKLFGNTQSATREGIESLSTYHRLDTLIVDYSSNISFLFRCASANITALRHLRHLSLRCCGTIVDDDLAHLAKLEHLQHLNLDNCAEITDAGVRHLTLLDLHHLNLSYCSRVTDACIAANIHRFTSLKFLAMTKLYITDASLRQVATLVHLATLDLRYCRNITDAGVELLCSLPLLSCLLLKECTEITDAAARLISRGLLRLESLDLSGCAVTDVSMASLALLPKLRTLDVSHCRSITDVGLQHLGSSHFVTLQQLCIGGCHLFSDAGLAHVAATMELSHLSLRGGADGVSDKGVLSIASMRHMRHLDLYRCSYATNAVLPDLFEMPLLEYLDVSCTHVTEAALEAYDAMSSPRLRCSRNFSMPYRLIMTADVADRRPRF